MILNCTTGVGSSAPASLQAIAAPARATAITGRTASRIRRCRRHDLPEIACPGISDLHVLILLRPAPRRRLLRPA